MMSLRVTAILGLALIAAAPAAATSRDASAPFVLANVAAPEPEPPPANAAPADPAQTAPEPAPAEPAAEPAAPPAAEPAPAAEAAPAPAPEGEKKQGMAVYIALLAAAVAIGGGLFAASQARKK